MQTKTNSCIIFSDVEPDDVGTLGIFMLLVKKGLIKVPMIVVGEGLEQHVRSKCAIVQYMLNLFGLTDIKLMCISATGYDWFPKTEYINSLFPVDQTVDSLTKNFKDVYGTDKVFGEMFQMISRGDINTFVSIMNHSVLIDFEKHVISNTGNSLLLKSITLCSYGSFNFRRLGKNQEMLIEHLDLYKDVHIGEAHHAFGQQNSINSTDHPEFFDFSEKTTDKSFKIILELFKKFSRVWDKLVNDDAYESVVSVIKKRKLVDDVESINSNDLLTVAPQAIEKFKRTIEQTTDEVILPGLTKDLGYIERNFKAYRSTLPKPGYQTVFADYLTAMIVSGVIDKYRVQKYIHFENAYTTLSDEPNTSVHQTKSKHNIYTNIGLDVGVGLLMSIM